MILKDLGLSCVHRLKEEMRGHLVKKIFRSRKLLIIDGDQHKVGKGHRDTLLSRYGEVHVFRNMVNEEIQQRQDVDATWCRYHCAPTSEKEAVDHTITFFCGQHTPEWRKDNVSVTIVSKDKTFRNTKALLESQRIHCELLPEIPRQRRPEKYNRPHH
jgi:hypothetical protein